MDLNNFTIVIPTRNEEKNIITFLDSLPPDIKLIVVDSSDDRTRELINIRRPLNTEIIFEKCNIPEARQIAADHTSTNWIIYSDCDMVFDKRYFTIIQNLDMDEKTGAIMGSKRSTKEYRLYYLLYSLGIMVSSWLTLPIGSGSNMIIRKKALVQINGFDCTLSHSEDSDILWRIRAAGWKVPFVWSLKVFEMDHRRLDRGVFKKFWHGTLRSFFLMTGINKKNVQKSDWGYWDK